MNSTFFSSAGCAFLGLAVSGAIAWSGCATTPEAPVEPTVQDKLARLMKLEDERSTGDGEVLARLADPAGRVRARASLVLGRLGSPAYASDLLPLLTDRQDFVRAMAAFSLGLLEGPLDASARDALESAIDDENETVRARAVEALGRKGGDDAAETIAVALAESIPRGREPYAWTDGLSESALTYPHHDLRLGIFALVKRSSLRWSWALLATEGATPRFEWWPAAWAVAELDGPEREPLLRFYAGSPNPEFRLWAARGFRSVPARNVRTEVRALLADPNERVRIAAVRAAAALALEEIAPDLLRLLESDTSYVRAVTLEALAVLPSPGAADPVIDELASESAWMRALALPALARQDPDGFWLLLSGLGDDPAWRVRSALAGLLGRIDDPRSSSLLRVMIDEADPRVRSRALSALGRREPEGAAPVLIAHLSAPDPYERLAAAEALARAGATEAAPAIEQAFLVEASGEPRVKPGLLRSLGALDAELSRGAAEQALDDESYLVRLAAFEILQRLGAQPAGVRERSSEHAVGFYRDLVEPPFTPLAYVQTSRGPTIELQLFVADAPLTVRAFMRLAREGFYDGLEVHRVVPNAFVAAGDPRGDGEGGGPEVLRSEINERPFVRGSVGLIDHGKDTGSSQFVITHLPRPDWDGRYTVFGQVTSGMETVDRLEPGDTIESITIWDGFNSPHRGR